MKVSNPFNSTTKQFEFASTLAIRFHYFSNMDQETFAALFEEKHIREMQKLGFEGFRVYQNPNVVKYIIEVVGRIKTE